MKITLTCWYSEDEHFTAEWRPDYVDGDKIREYIDEQVELRRLRKEKELRAAEAAEPKWELAKPPADTGPHADVFEYDGAFRCLNCNAEWGALPGKPEKPTACVSADQASHL